MTTLKDVMAVVDERGFVSVEGLSRTLGLPIDKAYQVIKACQDRGLLMPMQQAFFARPDGNGEPLDFRSKSSAKSRSSYYAMELQLIRDRLKADEGVGFSVQDIVILSEGQFQVAKVRKALLLMVELGELVCKEATAGGSFGHRPMIFGLDYKSISMRDKGYQERASRVADERRARMEGVRMKRKPKKRAAKKPADVPEVLAEQLEDKRRHEPKTRHGGQVIATFDEDYIE